MYNILIIKIVTKMDYDTQIHGLFECIYHNNINSSSFTYDTLNLFYCV